MSSGSVTLPQTGGSGGGGIVSINGSTASAQSIVGGAGINVSSSLGTTTVAASVIPIANGGTGQSNQQAGLNNITNATGGNEGDVLQLLGGNAQFAANPGVTYAQINAAIGAPANTFIASNNSSEIVGYNEWSLNEASKMSNVNILYQPNNLSAAPSAYTWNVNIDPLQDSPNDSLVIQNFGANLDSAATGFDMGTSGQSVTLLQGGLNYQGNGSAYGLLRYINMTNGFGNGTDPVEFKGLSAVSVGFNVAANATVSGPLSGYTYNAGLNAASITTSAFAVTVFSDFSQLPVDTYGYQGLTLQPSIATIKNTTNFNGIVINPTVTTLEGNANFFGFQIGGSITTQSATGSYIGGQINPNITHLTRGSTGISISGQTTDGTASWSGQFINTTAINTTGDVRALQISTADGQFAIDATGHCNLTTPVLLTSGLGQIYGHVVGGEIHIDDGSTPATVTGTDTIANNLAFTVNTGVAGSSWTAASIVGLTTLGFVGQITGAGTVSGPINFCLAGYADAHTGHIDRVNNFHAASIPTGAGGTMDEAILFFGEMPFGFVATDNWGLRVESALENYVERLAVSTTSKKVTNASCGIELGGTTQAVVLSRLTTAEKTALTAVNGMLVYDTDLDKFQGYEAGAWVNLV